MEEIEKVAADETLQPEAEILSETEPEVSETSPEEPQSESKGKKFLAAVKEWFRKKIVALKRAPHIIPLLVLAITTIYFMLVLFTISKAVYASNSDTHTPATGICTFITTLLSLLVLVSFLNSFPKRAKKPNFIFIAVVCVMIAAMVACDVVYLVEMYACLDGISNKTGTMYTTVNAGQPYIIGHLVLLGISSIVFALLPVIKILLNKINTSVKLESATENMQGKIDIQEG